MKEQGRKRQAYLDTFSTYSPKNRMTNIWQQKQSLTVLLHTDNKVTQPSIMSF